MAAVRGFTTLQLLELAAIAEANRLRSTGQVPVSKNDATKLEDLNRSRTVVLQLQEFLSQGGRPFVFPIKTNGLKLIEKLSGPKDSAALFNNGQLQPPYAARTADGLYIESQRGRIYDYLAGGGLAYVTLQRHYGLDYAFGKGGVPFSGAVLDKALTTSWREPTPVAGVARLALSPEQAFAERIRKLQAVWALTQRNVEPVAVERLGGVGRPGVRQPASEGDVRDRVAQSNGFISKNLAAAMKTGAQSSAQLYQSVVALAAGNPEALRERLWASLNQGSLNTLLGGLGIRKPEDVATGKRSFRYSAGQARGAQGAFDVAFSRFVYDELFDAYIQRGAGGDRMPPDAQARSDRRLQNLAAGIGPGARGVLGTNDKALQGLSLQVPAQVAKFIRKALQRQYTLEALKAGARALGVAINESAVLQDSVIQQAADHIIVSYNQQVQAGSAAHTSAVAEAVRLRGYGSLKTAEAVDQARRAIVRTLDAQNGFMTEPCQIDAKGHVTNYSKRDLKRIAKANGVSVAATATGAVACAAIGAVVARAPASIDALSSGRRQERTLAPQPKSGGRASGQRSGRRAAAPNALGAMAAGALSPNTQAAFAAFLPQQPAAGGLLGAGAAPAMAQRLSGSRSGSRNGSPGSQPVSPRMALAPAAQANNLMSLFGQQ